MTVVDVIGVALSIAIVVAFIAWLIHHAVHGEPERDREQSARDFYDRHGHWPDES